jgi:transposase InsO family protein
VDQAVVDLSREHPELGADKIGRMVRQANHRVSNQRVRHIRRQECLSVPPPRKKKRRLGVSTGKHPQKASYRGHVWTWDFIYDWTLKGGSCRILSVVDEYTRECHLLHVDRHIGAKKVQDLLEGLIQEHGAPDYIRSDNGPEFIATSLGHWLAENEIKTLYIEPGCPWQNGYVESFHDKFRRECLGRELFYTLSECRVVVGDWRVKYNQVRPHRSLGMMTPQEFANRQKPEPNHPQPTAKVHPSFRPTASTAEEPCQLTTI